MRFAGIDIASETHVVAAVDDEGKTVLKPTAFDEDAAGYQKLLELLGDASDCKVAMEATGHYWQNLFAALAAAGFEIALLNPIRTNRFAQEELARTKTDAIDALGIARFAQQKRPAPTRLPDSATVELRELVRLRDRVVQDMGDATRRLHRLVDLGFPEFTRYVKTLDSELATALLHEYPTAAAFPAGPKPLGKLVYDGRHKVGTELARQLVDAAAASVGRHHGDAYRVQVRYACEDVDVARRRLRELERRIETTLRDHEVGSLLTSITGIGPQTAARVIAEVGDFERFSGPEKLAAYVGAIPGLKHSGKSKPKGAMTTIGNARLRCALWMPLLTAVVRNPWLRAYYRRLVAAGKLKKVALVAAMRKLIHAIYSVAINRRPFVPRLQEARS
ncbi:MAG TPA: IS110 family transposase [Methylomirabilota bacterium]|nr:IS110 family transposase [Methylomirabilota bacterium]